jgi:hypothetical protein
MTGDNTTPPTAAEKERTMGRRWAEPKAVRDGFVALSDYDRMLLHEAGDVLLGFGQERFAYLAGALHGLAGRVPVESEAVEDRSTQRR